MIFSTPPEARAVIERYKNLRIGAKTVRCPYYRNPRDGRERWGLNAYSGKGSPEEIEKELPLAAKLEGKDFETLGEEAIRDIMKKRRLGVECSGFVAHVLDAWTCAQRNKRIFEVLKFPPAGIWGRIAHMLRPFTHIDVAMLAHPLNAEEFFDWRELCPGDIMRFNTEIDHAVLVTGVERGEKTIPLSITYAHSVREEIGEGIKEGIITIQEATFPLLDQRWQETPNTGHTIQQKGNLRLYHLRFLAQ